MELVMINEDTHVVDMGEIRYDYISCSPKQGVRYDTRFAITIDVISKEGKTSAGRIFNNSCAMMISLM